MFQKNEVREMASAFADVQSAPPIEVFQLGRDFAADTNPKKVRRWMSFFTRGSWVTYPLHI